MPAALVAVHRFEHVVLLPVWFGTERFPRRRVECWTIDSPTAVRQVLPIQFTVIGIHRSFQRADRVKALHELIAVWSRDRGIGETHASRVSAFEIFALLTDLRLRRVRGRAVGCRSHAQDPVLWVTRILEQRDVRCEPFRARYAGPAVDRANDPAVLLELFLIGVTEVVEKNRVWKSFGLCCCACQ